MNQMNKAAFVFSQSVAALAEIESMKALNVERESRGHAQAYDEGAFYSIIEKYGLDNTSVKEFLK